MQPERSVIRADLPPIIFTALLSEAATMRQDGRPGHRAWQSKKSDPGDDPKFVFAELQRRVLSDLESCRIAWEQEGDPLALCVALLHIQLPEWLTNGLLVNLTDGEEQWPALRAKAWRGRRRDAIDALRAAEITAVRSHPEIPQTWELSFMLAKHAIKEHGYTDVVDVDQEALKKSYQRVRRGLRAPGRYYRPAEDLNRRLRLAWANFLALMKVWLETPRAQKEQNQSTRPATHKQGKKIHPRVP